MKKKIMFFLASLLLLGGCFNINEKTEQEKAQEGTTPVQNYVGQGYSFVDGNKSAERVKKNEEEIKQVAIDYVKTKYKTNVKVTNVVPARNAAVVIVECKEPIQFTTSVTVGFILNKDEVGFPKEDEGEIEQAIIGGLYAKAYEAEFKHLNDFAEETAKKYNLLGMTDEALVKASPYGNQGKYYFITLAYREYLSVYNAYIENPQISVEELRVLFTKDDPTSENITIAMNFFSEEDKLPKQEVVDNLAKNFEKELGLPKGNYPFVIYKNLIVNRVGLPDGENIDAEIPVK
ncbi:DUF1672 family protein [Listeria swaminathanii]|uniref:DUF1672 family protein n=1 Tax=Listeria swaminathanii TaxID=2713501 RepID=A0ABU2IFF0_9LIST|nr:DUF1672 family protein [Listeria swaminathanii]MDT0017553.1 DUF1672 family protein [Listeria swaminathanii]MDT0022642.1 DUF1672 family protein [Listeria swaminathanii]MDT0033606.1 DUF1672 family protein [Listeria swaminathanii]MDT0052442.1 DUF1672 family protein [Listeria swaminathanii]MDT0055207.1 DUF1672 family protein [Listeria swaminathanii]